MADPTHSDRIKTTCHQEIEESRPAPLRRAFAAQFVSKPGGKSKVPIDRKSLKGLKGSVLVELGAAKGIPWSPDCPLVVESAICTADSVFVLVENIGHQPFVIHP